MLRIYPPEKNIVINLSEYLIDSNEQALAEDDLMLMLKNSLVLLVKYYRW